MKITTTLEQKLEQLNAMALAAAPKLAIIQAVD